MKISIYLSGAVRQFSYWFVHGTVGYPILEGIDYLNELDEDGSCMEQHLSASRSANLKREFFMQSGS